MEVLLCFLASILGSTIGCLIGHKIGTETPYQKAGRREERGLNMFEVLKNFINGVFSTDFTVFQAFVVLCLAVIVIMAIRK